MATSMPAAEQGRCRWGGKVTGMKIEINYDLCEANAICMGIAPEVFEVRDDDNLYILDEEPGEDMRDKIEEAVRRCPKQAIAIEG
jgi:ferredoxin